MLIREGAVTGETQYLLCFCYYVIAVTRKQIHW